MNYLVFISETICQDIGSFGPSRRSNPSANLPEHAHGILRALTLLQRWQTRHTLSSCRHAGAFRFSHELAAAGDVSEDVSLFLRRKTARPNCPAPWLEARLAFPALKSACVHAGTPKHAILFPATFQGLSFAQFEGNALASPHPRILKLHQNSLQQQHRLHLHREVDFL